VQSPTLLSPALIHSSVPGNDLAISRQKKPQKKPQKKWAKKCPKKSTKIFKSALLM